MVKKCPPGVLCMDWNLVTLAVVILVAIVGAVVYFGIVHRPTGLAAHVGQNSGQNSSQNSSQNSGPKIYVVNAPPQIPEERGFLGIRSPVTMATRAGSDRYQQIGILTGSGGSSGSAAPDRTILPLFGRELDSRRGKWNYFTRTDGNNPVQVPVRYRNRVCDDEMVGCEEVSSDDQVHVPSLGRSFAATVYRRSIFG